MSEASDALATWGAEQRALARALGLSIEEWLAELEAAGARTTGLTAAVVGAAMTQGLGLGILDRLDAAELVAEARRWVDPTPPRVDSPILAEARMRQGGAFDPILAEAIRRADELPVGQGAARLKRRSKAEPPRPERVETAPLPSSTTATPDAPGEEP